VSIQFTVSTIYCQYNLLSIQFTVNTIYSQYTDTKNYILCYVITSVLTRHYYGKYWLTAAKWRHSQPHESAGANGTEAFVISTRKLGFPGHVSNVSMTGKLKNRETRVSELQATGWTVWGKVPDSTAEGFLHTSTTNGITSCLKTKININYI